MTDEHIARVIRQGAVAMNRPSAMPANPDLQPSEIEELIAYIRAPDPGPPSMWHSRIDARTTARMLKFLGLALFGAGLAGVVAPTTRRRRLTMVYSAGVPGFVLLSVGGWLLTRVAGIPFMTPWVVLGAFFGFSALHVAFLASHLARPRRATAPLAWGCATSALLLMVGRFEAPMALGIMMLLGLAIGSLAGALMQPPDTRSEASDRDVAWLGLVWILRVETASLLLMLLISMPLRALFDLSLDAGTGLIGWLHGILVLMMLQALASVGPWLGFSRRVLALGIAVAVLPGAGFWYERRLRQQQKLHADSSPADARG